MPIITMIIKHEQNKIAFLFIKILNFNQTKSGYRNAFGFIKNYFVDLKVSTIALI
jgi:hypothetical protein